MEKLAYYASATVNGRHIVFPVYREPGMRNAGRDDHSDVQSVWPTFREAIDETGRLNQALVAA